MGNDVSGGITVRRINIRYGDAETRKNHDVATDFVAKALANYMVRKGEEKGIWLQASEAPILTTYSPAIRLSEKDVNVIYTSAKYQIRPRSDKGSVDGRDHCVIAVESGFHPDHVFMFNYGPSPNLNMLFDDFVKTGELRIPGPPDKSDRPTDGWSKEWRMYGGNLIKRNTGGWAPCERYD